MGTYSYEYILVSVADRLARIVLNRPQVSNALATKEFDEIVDAIGRLEADDEIGRGTRLNSSHPTTSRMPSSA